MVQHLSAQEIIQYISDAKKSTPLKVYVFFFQAEDGIRDYVE